MRWLNWLVIAGLLLAVNSKSANAQDDAAIKAANQSFYTALSGRDLKAMQAVWANKPYVVNIGPRSKAAAVGYDEAVTKYWDNAFNNVFSKMEAQLTSITQVHSDGQIAWISGVEKASLHLKSGGDPLNIENFVTNVFEKSDDHWRMILHHAQVVPK